MTRTFSVYCGSYSFDKPEFVRKGWKKRYERLVHQALQRPWSPCVWRDGRRKEANFLYADYLALDFDDGMQPWQEIANIFSDSKFALLTTKSHTEEHHRFRLVLVPERRIDCIYDYRFTVETLAERHGADTACFDGARFFWPSVEFKAGSGEGYQEAVLEAPPSSKRSAFEPSKFPSKYDGARIFPPWTRSYLKREYGPGERYTMSWRISKDLLRSGFSKDEIHNLLVNSQCFKGYEPEKFVKPIIDAEKALEGDLAYEREAATADEEAEDQHGAEVPPVT